MIALMGLHKEEFIVDGEKYTVIANFIDDKLTIRGRSFFKSLELNKYTNFEGNMQDYVEHLVKEPK